MKATEYIKALNDEKVIDPDWPTLKKDEFRARWKQGKCGIMVENFAALANKSNYKDFDENFPDGQWVAMDAVAGPDGEASMGTVMKTARIYAVSQKAIDEGKGEAIARFLEWTASEDGYFLLGFGVEGENYVLDCQRLCRHRGHRTRIGLDQQGNAAAHPVGQHGLHLLRS